MLCPRISSAKRNCASAFLPEPIEIVSIVVFDVNSPTKSSGTHSNSIPQAPVDSISFIFLYNCIASIAFFPKALNPPIQVDNLGTSPACP